MSQITQTLKEQSVTGFISRLSWSAIIAGVFTAVAIQLLLSFLGLGIGMGSIDAVEESKPFSGLGTGALIWWIVTMLLSLFTGGWVAGWFSNHVQKTDLILHGLLTWCLLTFLNLYLITSSVGKVVGGVGSVITKGFSLAGQGVKAAAPGAGTLVKEQLGIDDNTFSKMKEEAELLLMQTGKKELQPGAIKGQTNDATSEAKETGKDILENPQAAQEEIDSLFNKLFSVGESTFSEVDQTALVNVVQKRTGKSRAESEQIVNNWVTTLKSAKEKMKEVGAEAEQKAREVGDDVASAISKFALFSFLGLVVGAASASWGAILASRKRLAVVVESPVRIEDKY